MLITVLLSLLVLASDVALVAITSLFVAATSTPYLMSYTLLLWRRCTGGIRPYESGSGGIHGGPEWGPWNLHSFVSLWEPLLMGLLAYGRVSVWNLSLLFWSFWLQQNNPALDTVNWSIMVFGTGVLGSMTWYAVRARHYFKGPIKVA